MSERDDEGLRDGDLPAVSGKGELRELIERGGVKDRAFVDGVIRMKRGELDALYALLRDKARETHAPLRARIEGGLRGDELRAVFDGAPAEERDHFVEEVLGIAYPPLDETPPGREMIPYLPSGYDEILHAFERTNLAREQTFLDVGSGLGKAVMLASLLREATAMGIELDARLHDEASFAAKSLGLHARTRFERGDARTAPLSRADVVFMYLPFTGTILETVMARVLTLEPSWLCAGALDVTRYPALAPIGDPRSWLQVYAVGNSRVTDTSSRAPTT